MPLRPEFEAALRLFARIGEDMKERGYQAPVLVGGGAVDLYSNSTVMIAAVNCVTIPTHNREGQRLRTRYTT